MYQTVSAISSPMGISNEISDPARKLLAKIIRAIGSSLLRS